MAKGQKRSTREIRKPKQAKVPAVPGSSPGSQIKQAGSAGFPRAKPKT